MMHGMKKSDEAGVPLKAANKGVQTPAEPPEGRASTKGNPRDQSTLRTQGRDGVSQAVERVRQAATRKPQEKLTALMHHITTDALRCAFYDLKRTASAGVDGLVWNTTVPQNLKLGRLGTSLSDRMSLLQIVQKTGDPSRGPS